MIFLPGLNGDPRVLGRQREAFPGMTIARWITPRASESLVNYAHRLAPTIDPGRPCIVAGVSFGGVVALEVATQLRAKACVLIASSRDAYGLPTLVRLLRPLCKVIGPGATRRLIRGTSTTFKFAPRHIRNRLNRLAAEDLSFRKWGFHAMVTWMPTGSATCPIFQIHGELDDTFSSSRSRADRILPTAGHMLTVTHAEEVNNYLRSVLQSIGGGESGMS